MNRIIIRGLSLSVAAGTAAALLTAGIRLRPDNKPAAEVSAAVPIKSEAEAPEEEHGYCVRDYNGKIAVFGGDGENPVLISEISTSSLRSNDLALLESGIYADDISQVAALLEDFSG